MKKDQSCLQIISSLIGILLCIVLCIGTTIIGSKNEPANATFAVGQTQTMVMVNTIAVAPTPTAMVTTFPTVCKYAREILPYVRAIITGYISHYDTLRQFNGTNYYDGIRLWESESITRVDKQSVYLIIEIGDSPNHIQELYSNFKESDFKIITDDNQIAQMGDLVEITGPVFTGGNPCTIFVEKIVLKQSNY